ncbi:MAG TPA: peroxiredoxin [Pseudobdellovibrionaceae bacterium]|nr:peroxiredoxin [Pseudobdellovibrionaceae bacterium]
MSQKHVTKSKTSKSKSARAGTSKLRKSKAAGASTVAAKKKPGASKKVTTRKFAASSIGRSSKKVHAKKITGVSESTKRSTAKSGGTVKRVMAHKNQPSLVGHSVTDLRLSATGGREISLNDFSGKLVVLYFYPKDNTPGCTMESQDFARLRRDFEASGAVILGCSRDSVKSHDGFKQKYDLGFELLSDPTESFCRSFHVIQMKSLYGRQFEGVERSTFVVSREGVVLKEWRKVKVAGHAEEVLEFVRSLA